MSRLLMKRTIILLSALVIPAVVDRAWPHEPPPEKPPRSAAVYPPGVLLAMDARHGDRTAYAEVSVTYHATPRILRAVRGGAPRDPRAVRENRVIGMDLRETPATEFLTIETTAGTTRQTHWGDENGFRGIDHEVMTGDWKWERENYGTGLREVDAANLIKGLSLPGFALARDGAFWSRKGNSISADVWPPNYSWVTSFPTLVLDLATLGVTPMIRSEVLGRSIDDELGIPPRYAELPWETGRRSERTEGDLRTDSLALDHAGKLYRIEWVTDPSRDGQVVRSTLFEDDLALGHSVTTLEQMDGRWFPKSVTFFRDDFLGGRQSYLSFEVDTASFDERWHRQTPFTPSDIGCVFGTQLWVALPEYRHLHSKLGLGHLMSWDGVDIISYDEYEAMIHFYEMEPHPSVVEQLIVGTGETAKQHLARTRNVTPLFRRRWEKHYGAIDIPARPMNVRSDDWDLYVDAFVKQHHLTGERKTNAYRVLKHCKALRDWHRAKYKKAKKSDDPRRAKKLEERVDRIFDALKQGLRRLLPRSERRRRTP